MTRSNVVVIGGGPGGSTAAALLARDGFSVTLLERERFPRDHVGESLLPASMPVLEELGVLDRVAAAGFPKKYGATMLWGREPDAWSWRFAETNRAYPHAYQVHRAEFDAILLDNARSSGADVRERCAVTAVLRDGERVSGVRYRSADGAARVAAAEWVIDASGQSALVGRALGLRRWDDRFRNMAVYGYFEGGERLPEPDETNIFIESYENGWVWNIPLSGGLASVGVVVDSERGRDDIAALSVPRYFRRQLDAAPRTRRMLCAARSVAAPRVVKDWSYTSERTAGDGWILVGDAACFVDPLFSSGVHLAMMSAVMAAAYIRAVSRDASMRESAARVYQRLYRTEYAHFRELAALFYASNRAVDSYFWEARRLLGAAEDETARAAFVRAVAGQPPRGYERAVLERGELPPETIAAINAVESERGARRNALDAERVLRSVPRLARGARVERMPIFADGEFAWSDALVSPQRPDGLPLSKPVAALAAGIDGRRETWRILDSLTAAIPSPDQRRMAASAMLDALRLLAVDGAVEF